MTRYTPDKFYGVIDTGASQKSTAGYNQFLAYGKTYPTNIDTTRAGQVTVQFGIPEPEQGNRNRGKTREHWNGAKLRHYISKGLATTPSLLFGSLLDY